MNQPKKLEPVLDAIRSLLADRTRAPGDYALAQAVWDLGLAFDILAEVGRWVDWKSRH